MPDGTGLNLFAERFPERCFDVGIAEQHAVTFCAGMAAAGMKPFCAIYSTFLQRGYDQVVHDVAIQRLPVRFAIDRAGLVGADGPTHAGAFDIAFLACLPDFVVMAAADEAELVHMVATAAAIDDRPSRLPLPARRGRRRRAARGAACRSRSAAAGSSWKGRGSRSCPSAPGLAECLKAAEALAARGIRPTVADARFAKPLDRDLILRLARDHGALITIEEGSVGGFGSHVAQLLAEEGVFDRGLKFRSMVLPDSFIQQDSPERMYAAAAMNAGDIEAKVLALLDVAHVRPAAGLKSGRAPPLGAGRRARAIRYAGASAAVAAVSRGRAAARPAKARSRQVRTMTWTSAATAARASSMRAKRSSSA